MMDARSGVKTTNCAACGYRMDAASVAMGEEARPAPGDFSLCLSCGHVMVFDHELEPVPMVAGELDALDPEQRADVLRAQYLIRRRGPITRVHG
jgi:hypothetical protein